MYCFACLPEAPTGPEPRMLCDAHKRRCVLADGAPLQATLALLGSIEGSSLGWLYNPVFVVDSAAQRQRGWTDFAGGGMAVLEDRFDAQNRFESWMCERADMVELLRNLPSGERASRGDHATIENSLRSRFLLAYEMWGWNRAIEERRAALGRWPASIAELEDVLRSPPSERDLSPQGEAAFHPVLASLAERRRVRLHS